MNEIILGDCLDYMRALPDKHFDLVLTDPPYGIGMRQEDMKHKEEKVHPTQKPLPLFLWLLEKYSQSGQTVLDPFSGSGTTAIAAHRLGRPFVCVEKDAEYHAASVERLRKEREQLLFNF